MLDDLDLLVNKLLRYPHAIVVLVDDDQKINMNITRHARSPPIVSIHFLNYIGAGAYCAFALVFFFFLSKMAKNPGGEHCE